MAPTDRQVLRAQRDHAWEQLEELLVVNERMRELCRERFVKIAKLEAEIERLRGRTEPHGTR